MTSPRLLLRRCEVGGRGDLDVLVADGLVGPIVPTGRRPAGPPVDLDIDVGGGALLPGLHDHHVHLFAEAARRSSVSCGPPDVVDQESLVSTLRAAARRLPPGAWLRGVDYDSRRGGPLDRVRLDAAVSDRPVRMKDRSGLSWTLNSEALRVTGLEPRAADGVLLGEDRLLQEVAPAGRPDLHSVESSLVGFGITGVTDTTPDNTAADLMSMRSTRVRVRAMAGPDQPEVAGVTLPTLKLVLQEHHADVEGLAAAVEKAHAAGWNVAVHAVTRVETVAAVAAFGQAGATPGDRLEHASVLPAELVRALGALGVAVVSHPGFVARRGDAYLADVDPEDRGCLYRLRSLLDCRVPLGGGSDAPVGDLDPWSAMTAAVCRETPDHMVLGREERLSPEQALRLFLGAPERPGGPARTVRPGEVADLCVLTEPWSVARGRLAADLVRATVVDGHVAWEAGC